MFQTTDPESLASALAHFTGTQSYINLRYPWLRMKFLLTEGAQYLAEKGQCYWLMDAIASHQINSKVSSEPFQAWTLKVGLERRPTPAEKRRIEKGVPADLSRPNFAVLTCTDGNEKLLARQEIPYTDFPLPSITLYAALDESLGGLVVMLPSEY